MLAICFILDVMGDLPQSNGVVSSGTKKTFLGIEYGFGGILAGLVFFILILVILNYTSVINLSDLLSLIQKNAVNKLPQKVSIIEKKAKAAGYSIIWQGDKSDISGRTVLVSQERKFNGYSDSFGWTNSTSYSDPNKQDFYKAMGVFQGWESIAKSKDKYIILINPNNKEEIKARIMIEKNPEGMITGLFVDNLNNNSKQPNNSSEKIDSFSNISSNTLNKLIKIGDVVIAYMLPLSIEKEVKTNFQAKRDINLKPITLSIVIRRFGGKAEIKNEIQ
ncbi:hypothetical protein M1349_00995 [Patescibacteria group bacterium]|nr:hypothetical protein [Patescibacteria group bacterium]